PSQDFDLLSSYSGMKEVRLRPFQPDIRGQTPSLLNYGLSSTRWHHPQAWALSIATAVLEEKLRGSNLSPMLRIFASLGRPRPDAPRRIAQTVRRLLRHLLAVATRQYD